IISIAGRNGEIAIHDAARLRVPLGRLLPLVEDEPYLRAILPDLAVGSVVHLPNQLCAGGNSPRDSRWQNHRHVAASCAYDKAIPDSSPTRTILGFGITIGHDDMVNHGTIARPGLGRLHPNVLLEVRGRDEVLVRDGSRSRNGLLGWQLEDHVRLADYPAIG